MFSTPGWNFSSDTSDSGDGDKCEEAAEAKSDAMVADCISSSRTYVDFDDPMEIDEEQRDSEEIKHDVSSGGGEEVVKQSD